MSDESKILNPGGLAWALAHAPAGSDTASIVAGSRDQGYTINVPGYDLHGAAEPAAEPPPTMQGFGREALSTAAAGAAGAAGFAGGERAMQELMRSRTGAGCRASSR